MVCGTVNSNQFLLFISDKTWDLLLKPFLVFWFYESLSAFNGEDNLDIYLAVGWHNVQIINKTIRSSNIYFYSGFRFRRNRSFVDQVREFILRPRRGRRFIFWRLCYKAMMPSASIFYLMVKINLLNPVLSDWHEFNLIVRMEFRKFRLQADTEKPEQSR